MNILLLTILYPGYVGEPRNETTYALHYFAKEWNQLGHETKVIKICPNYPKIFNKTKKGNRASKYNDGKFNIHGVDVERITIKKYPKIDYFDKDILNTYERTLNSLEGEFKPDIIVCHMINPFIYIGELLKKELDIPLMLTIHNTDIGLLKNKGKKLDKFIKTKKNIDSIGFRSHKIKEKYNEIFNINKKNKDDNQHLILSGIEKKHIINEEQMNKKVLKKTKRILIASSLIPLKNVDILISAFEELYEEYNDVTLEIIGDGPEKTRLQKLVEGLKSKDSICFLGQISRDEVMKKMEISDIFAMVSSPETFGLVYIEAMSKGCIVIGSKGEGIDGVIKHNKNGFLCTPRNTKELKRNLLKSIRMTESDKKNILTQAVDTAKNMTQEKLSKQYLQILNDNIKMYKSKNKKNIK